MKTRLLVFAAGCGLLLLWVFPQTDFIYSRWSNEENRWVAFKTISQRAFITNIDFGTTPSISPQNDDFLGPMLRNRTVSVPWGYGLQKQVTVRWLTQLVQSALIVAISVGLFWAVREFSHVQK